MKNMKRSLKIIAICFAVFLILTGAWFWYVGDYYHADADVYAGLSDHGFSVETIDNLMIFSPDDPIAGLVFYPGGKVEHTAYVPLMSAMAEQGILCILVEMPCRLAILDGNAADGLTDAYPEITDWYIGGHSLGGVMASSYASEHPEDWKGLLLLAAYSSWDLRESGLHVVSVYGTNDGVLNRKQVEKNRTNLPSDQSELVIEGGCHAFFGAYGAQKGDGIPEISRDEQIGQTVSFFLETVKGQ